MTQPATKLDPVTLEVLEHKLWQITNEMGLTLSRVTGSPITTDARDFITAVCRSDSKLLMSSAGVLLHAVTLPYAIQYIMENYTDNPGIHEGDAFLMNDPFICSVHAPDMYVVSPIFYKGELVAWSGAMTHLVDIGGVDPGSISPRAEDCWQEGLRLPGVKLVDRGAIRQDLWEMIRNMVRDPGMVFLDIRGMVACGQVAAQRLLEMIEENGMDTYNALSEEIITSAEARMRARLRELSDGSWSTRIYYDEDGRTDRIYEIPMKLTKKDDTITFDLTGASEQAPSFINCGVRGAKAAIFGALAVMIGYDIPWSQGIIDVIDVIAPEGTLINPVPPAPTSLGTIGAADAVMGGTTVLAARMLMASPGFDQDLTAMWGVCGGCYVFAAVNQFGDFRVQPIMQAGGAGAGARSYADGVNTAGNLYIPEYMMPNTETNEYDLPVLFLYMREAPDTGGHGKWRGGNAVEYAVVLHDAPLHNMVVPHLGRGANTPVTHGISGGYPAANWYMAIRRGTNVLDLMQGGRTPQGLDELAGGEEEKLRAVGVTMVNDGDMLVHITHGGGGYGDPLDRDPERVRADVADSNVSQETARDVYGVVLEPATLDVDEAATSALRKSIKEERLRTLKASS